MCKAGHKPTPPVALHRAPGSRIAHRVKEFQRLYPNPMPCLVVWVFFLQRTPYLHVAQGTSFANASPASVFETVLKFLSPLPHPEMMPHIWSKPLQAEPLLAAGKQRRDAKQGWSNFPSLHCFREGPKWSRDGAFPTISAGKRKESPRATLQSQPCQLP